MSGGKRDTDEMKEPSRQGGASSTARFLGSVRYPVLFHIGFHRYEPPGVLGLQKRAQLLLI